MRPANPFAVSRSILEIVERITNIVSAAAEDPHAHCFSKVARHTRAFYYATSRLGCIKKQKIAVKNQGKFAPA